MLKVPFLFLLLLEQVLLLKKLIFGDIHLLVVLLLFGIDNIELGLENFVFLFEALKFLGEFEIARLHGD